MEIDIRNSVFELAHLMNAKPYLIETGLVNAGAAFLGLYEDENFGDRFQNLTDLKTELFLTVCEDLAMGAVALKTSAIGLQFVNGSIRTFMTPYGSLDGANVLFSISIRKVAAFKNWRNVSEIDFQPAELHSGIYFITHCLAEHLAKK